jgi:hypothetical protein
MVVHLGSTISVSKACEVVALIPVCERVSFCAGEIAENSLDCFPMYATRVVKELR